MSTEIYYFSGTGNSLAAARDIARKTGGKLIPIAPLMDRKSIKLNADMIGIVFPACFWGLRPIIKRLAEKLEDTGSKYIFAVCTCGGMAGKAVRILDDVLKRRGGKLSAGFIAAMPGNYIFEYEALPAGLQKMEFDGWKKKLEFIDRYITARKSGRLETVNFVSVLFAPLLPLFKALDLIKLNKLAGTRRLSFIELIPLLDRGFYPDEKCDGCGICAKVCPVKDIKMKGGRPLWLHHCEQCFACLQWCPKEAIQYGGNTAKRKRYHHPGVKISDFINRD